MSPEDLEELKKHADYPVEEHETRLAIGDPKAVAFAWIQAYTKNLNRMIDDDYNDDYGPHNHITISELIETAESQLNPHSYGDYIVRGGTFEGHYVDDLFWDKLAVLKEIEIPQNKRNSFFSCSC